MLGFAHQITLVSCSVCRAETHAFQDLGWCVTDPYDDPFKDVFDPFDYDYTMEDAFYDTQCASTSCGVEKSPCSGGAAPGNGGGEVGYAPTYRPTQGPGSGDDS